MVKRLAVTAAVAVAGFAGAATAAQASPTWTNPGDFEAAGQVSAGYAVGSPYSFTCDVQFSGNAANVAGVAKATISDFTAGNCYSYNPQCSVDLQPSSSPSSWAMTVSGSAAPFRVHLGMYFTLNYSGAGCNLSGASVPVEGTVGSTFAQDSTDSWLEFDYELGLMEPYFRFPLNGYIYFYPTANGVPGLI